MYTTVDKQACLAIRQVWGTRPTEEEKKEPSTVMYKCNDNQEGEMFGDWRGGRRVIGVLTN